jgi:signal transduction histidine kinase
MIAATSLTLGMIQLLAWWQNREKRERLLFALMTVATAWMAFCELAMMQAKTPGDFGFALRWLHVPVLLNFFAITGFALVHLRAGRRWLAGMLLALRSVSLVINFSVEPNINFREITGLQEILFLGTPVTLPIGPPNPLMVLPQLALLLLLAFVVDSTMTVWRRGYKRRALLTGGCMSFFIAMGTLQSVLSYWNVVEVPGFGSAYFLGMIVLIAFDLSLETKRAATLEVELRDTRASKHREVTHLGRVAAFGEISVSLAHEMNQPLGIILSNAQAAQKLLAKESPDLQQVREILGDIVSEDLRASESIKRMRSLLQRGEVSRQSIDFNDVATEVFHLMKNELTRREVVLSHQLTESLPAVSADRIQLQQVLLNLMLNACEAMETNAPGTRRLHVATASDGKAVTLEVTDAGHGLPADPEAVFQPFHTTKTQGLGMGLAICRSIITAHHGQLWAEPDEQGGATFHVVLPVTEGAP